MMRPLYKDLSHHLSFLLPCSSTYFCKFEEVYSIVRALKDYTVYCQTTYEATAEGGMQKMVSLLSLTLEPTKDLVMLRVPEISVVGEEEQDDDNSPADPTDVKRRHADLTDTGRQTREAVNRALARRFLARYIGPGLTKRTHLFDHF